MSTNPFLDTVDRLGAERETPASNPFADSVEEVEQEERQVLRRSLVQAAGMEPVRRGQALDLATDVGAPVDLVERRKADFERFVRVRRFPIEDIERSPALRRFFSNVNHATVGMEDAEALVEFWRGMNGQTPGGQLQPPPLPSLGEVLAARFARGQRTAQELPDVAMPLIVEALGGPEARAGARARFDALLARPVGPTGRPGFLDDVAGPFVEQLPILGGTTLFGLVGAVEGAVAGAALGTVVPGAGTGAGAITGAGAGFKAGTGLRAFQVEASAAYAEFQGLTDENGEPLPEETIAAGAAVVGAINAGLEVAGFIQIARTVPGLRNLLNLVGLGRKAITKAVQKRLTNSATRGAVRTQAREALRALGFEVGTELAQEETAIQAGGVLSGEGLGLRLEETGRRLEIAKETALAVTPLVGAGTTVNVTLDRVIEARQLAGRIEATRAAVRGAKLRTLSPRIFRDLTDSIAREAGIEEIGIPFDRLSRLYEGDLDALLRDVPEATDQLAEAELTGGDLLIPVGRYFETLEPRFGDALTEDLRLRADSLTLREAQAAEERIDETAERAVARELELAEADPVERETEAARDKLAIESLFDAPETAGMTQREFETYQRTVEESRQKAADQLAREIEQEENRRQSEEFRERREAVQAEVEREVNQEPTYRALHWLQRGEFLDGPTPEGLQPVRMDRQTIVDLYGEETLKRLPFGRFGVWQKDGIHPDVVAELFGFASGTELVQAILAAAPRSEAIEQRTNARMIERFGDMRFDGTLQERAVDAVENNDLFRALLIEERALAKRVGGRPSAIQVVRNVARRLVSEMPIRKLQPQRHRQAAARWARAAVEALRSGDFLAAQDAKRRQILNLALEQEARRAKQETETARRQLRRVQTRSARERIGKAGASYLDQIDALLDRFDLRRISRPATERRQALADWIEERKTEGEEVVIPAKLRQEAFLRPWQDLTVADFLALRDSVENIRHLSRLKTTLQRRQEQRALDRVAEDIIGRIDEAFSGRRRPTKINPGELDRAMALARTADAWLSRPEFLIDALQGNDPTSPLREIVITALQRATERRNDMLDDYAARIERLLGLLGDDRMRDYRRPIADSRLRLADGSPNDFNKWNLIVIALNLGNASNKDKLLRGYGWDEQTVLDVLSDHLDGRDAQFIQGVWDEINTLWPEIEALQRRVSGVAPPKIEATEITIAGETLRGGYFPVAYDSRQSRLGKRIEITDLLPDHREAFTRATTGHGFTEERTNVAGPIRLEVNVLSKHLDDVILDLTHREALLDIGRVLSREDVDSAIVQALGPEFSYLNFWKPWLQSVARDRIDPGALGLGQRIARTFRIHATAFKLGFRETTLIAQVAGNFNGMRLLQKRLPRHGISYWLDGVWRAMGKGSPREMLRVYKGVMDRSPFMRQRLQKVTVQRDLRDAVRSDFLERGVRQEVVQFAFRLIGRVQLLTVDLPVWLAAHRGAIELMDLTEEQATRFADSMVRLSQGGGTRVDQSLFERGGQGGNEFAKAMTLYYSYNNAVYNQLRNSSRGKGLSVSNVPTFLADYFFFVIMPGLYATMMYGVLRGRLPDPDRDDFDSELRLEAAQTLVGDAAQTIPFVRDVWHYWVTGVPRSASAFDLVRRELLDLANVKDGMDLMFDALRVGALTAGLPGDRPLRAAEELLRVED